MQADNALGRVGRSRRPTESKELAFEEEVEGHCLHSLLHILVAFGIVDDRPCPRPNYAGL